MILLSLYKYEFLILRYRSYQFFSGIFTSELEIIQIQNFIQFR